ncbi:unnamed protein product [Closterium sp. Yama58-4]|nr:unnamed protein product [Closterium sp. Yama58-4]
MCCERGPLTDVVSYHRSDDVLAVRAALKCTSIRFLDSFLSCMSSQHCPLCPPSLSPLLPLPLPPTPPFTPLYILHLPMPFFPPASSRFSLFPVPTLSQCMASGRTDTLAVQCVTAPFSTAPSPAGGAEEEGGVEGVGDWEWMCAEVARRPGQVSMVQLGPMTNLSQSNLLG